MVEGVFVGGVGGGQRGDGGGGADFFDAVQLDFGVTVGFAGVDGFQDDVAGGLDAAGDRIQRLRLGRLDGFVDFLAVEEALDVVAFELDAEVVPAAGLDFAGFV